MGPPPGGPDDWIDSCHLAEGAILSRFRAQEHEVGCARIWARQRGRYHAHYRDGATGLRQGGARGHAGARRPSGRRPLRAGQGGPAGRPHQGFRAREGPAGPSAGLLQGPGGARGIARARGRPLRHGLRHHLRAGRGARHPDPRLDLLPSLAPAPAPGAELDQLADHRRCDQDRDHGLLPQRRPGRGRHPAPEGGRDRPRRHARQRLFRQDLCARRRRHAGIGRPHPRRQGAAHCPGPLQGEL